jgi:Leucine-rich repeat (LRR) protein
MISINGKKVNTDIRHLNLSYNNLTQLPVEIGQLTQLTTLDLSNNNITHLGNLELKTVSEYSHNTYGSLLIQICCKQI